MIGVSNGGRGWGGLEVVIGVGGVDKVGRMR